MVTLSVFAVFFAFAPVIAQGLLLQRTPLLALRVTPRTAVAYGLRSALLLWLAGAFATGAFGLSVGTAFLVLIGVWYTAVKTVLPDIGRMHKLVRLANAGDTERAVAFAYRAASAARRHGTTHVTARVTLACAHVIAALDVGEAERLVATLEKMSFSGETGCSVAHALAIYRIALRRYDEAQKTMLRAGETPPTHALSEQRALLLARIEAATGEADRALERIGARQGDDWDAARAHAYAALSRSDEARATLERLRASKGESYLQEIVRRQGPAAAVAAAVLAEDHPYR